MKSLKKEVLLRSKVYTIFLMSANWFIENFTKIIIKNEVIMIVYTSFMVYAKEKMVFWNPWLELFSEQALDDSLKKTYKGFDDTVYPKTLVININKDSPNLSDLMPTIESSLQHLQEEIKTTGYNHAIERHKKIFVHAKPVAGTSPFIPEIREENGTKRPGFFQSFTSGSIFKKKDDEDKQNNRLLKK